MWRLAGGDVSDGDQIQTITDVPGIFDVFGRVTFELAKMNLKVGDEKSRSSATRHGSTSATPPLSTF